MMLCLSILTAFGLVFYVTGRKAFLTHIKNKKLVLPTLTILGLILMVEGAFFGSLTGLGPEEYHLTLKDLPDFTIYTTWYLFRIISGILFLAEGAIIAYKKRKELKSDSVLLLTIPLTLSLTIQPISATQSWNNHIPEVSHGNYFWDSPSNCCPQPYVVGYMDTNIYLSANKTRITVSFPDTNSSTIQEDNRLSGGMFVVGYDAALVQIDYGFYAVVSLNHNGSLSLDFGIIQTYECLPTWPYICPFGIYPWVKVLSNTTKPLVGVPHSTPITLTASWDSDHYGWISWDYAIGEVTYNAGSLDAIALAPTVIPRFWLGARNIKWIAFIGWMPYWQTYLFQFGITSRYNIGHEGWNILLSNPSYFKNGKWHSVEKARSIGGLNAMLDTRWMWGGANYAGVNACYYEYMGTCSASFNYLGSTMRDHTILWDISNLTD